MQMHESIFSEIYSHLYAIFHRLKKYKKINSKLGFQKRKPDFGFKTENRISGFRLTSLVLGMYPLWGVYQALRVGPIYPTSCFMFRTSRHRITFLLSPLPLEPNVTAVLTKITPERHAAEVLWKSSACVNFSDLKNDSHCTACNSNNSVAVRRL